MKTRLRPGFSFFDLLVLLAVLGLLLALLLPAIQKVRAAASRMASQNNLKQLGIACHAYHDGNNRFPPGNDKNGFSAAAELLPYLEQNNLYTTIDFDKPVTDKANARARKTVVKLFLDPQDPLSKVTEASAATNYLFNAGSKPSLVDNDGIFYQDSKVKFSDITDGTSNTLMIGETLKGDGGLKAVDLRRQYVVLKGKDALKNLKDDSGVKEWKASQNIAGDRCASWMEGRFLQGTFTATRPINDKRPDVSCEGGKGGLSALRTLGPGVNAAFCDGSVHFIKATIDPKIFKALATRNGGEDVSGSGDF